MPLTSKAGSIAACGAAALDLGAMIPDFLGLGFVAARRKRRAALRIA